MTELKTPNTGLPLLAPGQGLKYITVNESLLALDKLVQLSVKAELNAPPEGCTEHDIYLVGSSPIDTFANHSARLAAWQNGQWIFIMPKAGWRVYNQEQDDTLIFDGSNWKSQLSSRLFGINAEANETNRLSVNSEAVLFNHNGQNSRVTVNKAHVNDTASILYQIGFSGRAEIGLSGSDVLQIKVSPDGAQWVDALTVDPGSGVVSCPQGLLIAGEAAAVENDLSGQIQFKGEIGDLADLDNFQSTGIYHQTSNILAENGINYPVAKAGLLSVVANGLMIFQTFHVWSGAGATANRFHIRGAYNGVWGAWREI